MKSLRLALLLAVALLSACSTGTRLAYNNLDTLMRLEIGSLVDLEPAQKQALDTEFKTVWDWHRQTELPAYASALRQLAAEVDQGNPNRVSVDRIANLVGQHAETFSQHALPGTARLMASLDDAQVDEVIADQRQEIDKNLRNQSKETAAARSERLADEMADSLEDWLGSLLPAQRTLIQQRLADAEARGALAHEREHAQALVRLKHFADVLASRAQPGFAQRLLALAEPADRIGLVERDAARERGRHYFATLGGTLDADQRRHFAKRLRRYAEDCVVLAAKPLESDAP